MKVSAAGLGLACMNLVIGGLILIGTTDAKIDLETVAAMWLFDEGKGDIAEDSSGNGHDGVFNGNVGWAKGKFGEALQLDGTSAHVNAGVVPLTDNSFSVALWVYMEDVPAGWVHVVENGSVEHAQWYGSFRLEPGAEEGRFYVSLGDNVQSIDNGANGQLIGWKTKKWEHLAVTYDGARCRIYLNGAEVDGFDTNADVTAGVGTVIIGSLSGGSRFYNGLVDELAIFNIALSADDINAIMSKGLQGAALVSRLGKLATTWSGIKNH
jgi:hypothetical protein